jgi:hypothetical protein
MGPVSFYFTSMKAWLEDIYHFEIASAVFGTAESAPKIENRSGIFHYKQFRIMMRGRLSKRWASLIEQHTLTYKKPRALINRVTQYSTIAMAQCQGVVLEWKFGAKNDDKKRRLARRCTLLLLILSAFNQTRPAAAPAERPPLHIKIQQCVTSR